MTRQLNRLTPATVEALDEPGLHADGAGLYLRIDETLAKRWVWIFSSRGRRREMGLGSASLVSLINARQVALSARLTLLAGMDPIEARRSGNGLRAA